MGLKRVLRPCVRLSIGPRKSFFKATNSNIAALSPTISPYHTCALLAVWFLSRRFWMNRLSGGSMKSVDQQARVCCTPNEISFARSSLAEEGGFGVALWATGLIV